MVMMMAWLHFPWLFSDQRRAEACSIHPLLPTYYDSQLYFVFFIMRHKPLGLLTPDINVCKMTGLLDDWKWSANHRSV